MTIFFFDRKKVARISKTAYPLCPVLERPPVLPVRHLKVRRLSLFTDTFAMTGCLFPIEYVTLSMAITLFLKTSSENKIHFGTQLYLPAVFILHSHVVACAAPAIKTVVATTAVTKNFCITFPSNMVSWLYIPPPCIYNHQTTINRKRGRKAAPFKQSVRIDQASISAYCPPALLASLDQSRFTPRRSRMAEATNTEE